MGRVSCEQAVNAGRAAAHLPDDDDRRSECGLQQLRALIPQSSQTCAQFDHPR